MLEPAIKPFVLIAAFMAAYQLQKTVWGKVNLIPLVHASGKVHDAFENVQAVLIELLAGIADLKSGL